MHASPEQEFLDRQEREARAEDRRRTDQYVPLPPPGPILMNLRIDTAERAAFSPHLTVVLDHEKRPVVQVSFEELGVSEISALALSPCRREVLVNGTSYTVPGLLGRVCASSPTIRLLGARTGASDPTQTVLTFTDGLTRTLTVADLAIGDEGLTFLPTSLRPSQNRHALIATPPDRDLDLWRVSVDVLRSRLDRPRPRITAATITCHDPLELSIEQTDGETRLVDVPRPEVRGIKITGPRTVRVTFKLVSLELDPHR